MSHHKFLFVKPLIVNLQGYKHMSDKKRTALLMGALCVAVVSVAQASGPRPYHMPNPGVQGSRMESAYVALYGGVGWARSTKRSANVMLVAPLVTNRYDFSRASRSAPVLGVEYGYLWRRLGGHSVNVSLGLETGYTRVLSPSGRVRPLYFINPGFDTLDFRYAVSSVPLLVVSMLQFPLSSWTPYVLGGLGMSWNRASDYQEVPTDPVAGALAIRSPFRPRTIAGFAYTVGAGVSYALSARTGLGIEYRFTSYGQARLNPSAQQTTRNRLSLGTITSNALLLRLGVCLG